MTDSALSAWKHNKVTIIIWRESVGLQIPVNFVINENCQYLYYTDNQKDMNNIAIVSENYLFCMAVDAASLIFNFVKVLMRWSQNIYILKSIYQQGKYLGKDLFENNFLNGKIVIKVQGNRKNPLMSVVDKIPLWERALTEAVNDRLKNIAHK